MKRLRVYADTSVFGGCFDEEFEADSRKPFDEIEAGRFILVVSATTLRELRKAPEEVRQLLAGISRDRFETTALSEEVQLLRDAYLKAGVVSASSSADAEHIASASVAEADMIVSWNFKHIVHFEKIRGYHAVNLLEGYKQIPIYTPKEVIG